MMPRRATYIKTRSLSAAEVKKTWPLVERLRRRPPWELAARCRVDARALLQTAPIAHSGAKECASAGPVSAQGLVRELSSGVRMCRDALPYQFAIATVDFARDVYFCESESDDWFLSELPMA